MTPQCKPARRALCLATALAMFLPSVHAASSPAASACPDYFFMGVPSGSPGINLAVNPSFEVATPGLPGPKACWSRGDPANPPSAAAGWIMHTNNDQASICTFLVPSEPIGPTGARMLAVRAGAHEGGVFQDHRLDPAKAYMFSVWVKVYKGKVAIQSNSSTGGPVSWTTKIGEWEQLRVCTNSMSSTNSLIVYNQAAEGGSFVVDRVELIEIPIRE